MIGRITERRELERVHRDGRRARTRSLWCRYLDEPGVVPPRVAFAVPRAIGTAVTRNRLRRRLRELLRRAAVSEPPLFPSGQLLLGARPGAGELAFVELDGELTRLLRALGAPVVPS